MAEYSYRLHFKALNVLFQDQGLDPKMGVSPSHGIVVRPPPPPSKVCKTIFTLTSKPGSLDPKNVLLEYAKILHSDYVTCFRMSILFQTPSPHQKCAKLFLHLYQISCHIQGSQVHFLFQYIPPSKVCKTVPVFSL